ncbi:MAG: hypothetical protein IOC82_16015 [Aestuariivirga sp.]|uniref:hypothetical protein n=1 Tax=Aestuariivirga sp. TaxID=2650926 RepID=UPI0025B97138|nr:hypothetical protein [Aestuariivirga sp.]MCA3562523.1 hypothetical protein [Aestuariivirga sp.]
MKWFILGSAGVLMALTAGQALAVDRPTVNVACSAKKKLQAAIDKAKAGSETTINVTGNCVENLEIPAGKTIYLVGKSGATITAANGAWDTVNSIGRTNIYSMNIVNPSGTADVLVSVEKGGVLEIFGSTLSAPQANYVFGVWQGSTGRLSNSRLTGGTQGGINIWERGLLRIEGRPDRISGPDGATTTITSSRTAQDGVVSCGVGSSLWIDVRKNASTAGQVLIKDSYRGLDLSSGCSAYLDNKTGDANNLKISGMSNRGVGANHSMLVLRTAAITGNGGTGIDAVLSNVEIGGGSSLSGNSSADIISGPGNTFMIQGWDGPNAIPDAFNAGDGELWCWPNSEASADNAGKITIVNNGVQVPAGKTIGDLGVDDRCTFVE